MAGKKKEGKSYAEMTTEEKLTYLDNELKTAKENLKKAKSRILVLENKKNNLIISEIEKKAKGENKELKDLM